MCTFKNMIRRKIIMKKEAKNDEKKPKSSEIYKKSGIGK